MDVVFWTVSAFFTSGENSVSFTVTIMTHLVLPTYVCQIALFRHLNAADMSLADVVLEGNKWHILKPAGLRVDCFKTEYLFLKNKNQFQSKTGKKSSIHLFSVSIATLSPPWYGQKSVVRLKMVQKSFY